MPDMKLHDMKLTDQKTGHENKQAQLSFFYVNTLALHTKDLRNAHSNVM